MSYADRISMQQDLLAEMAAQAAATEVFYKLVRAYPAVVPCDANLGLFVQFAKEVHDTTLSYEIGVEAMSHQHFVKTLAIRTPEDSKQMEIQAVLNLLVRARSPEELAVEKQRLNQKTLQEVRDRRVEIEQLQEHAKRSVDDLKKIVRAGQVNYAPQYPVMPRELSPRVLKQMTATELRSTQHKYGPAAVDARLAGRD